VLHYWRCRICLLLCSACVVLAGPTTSLACGIESFKPNKLKKASCMNDNTPFQHPESRSSGGNYRGLSQEVSVLLIAGVISVALLIFALTLDY
jgi:hypothetical protein